MAVISKIRGRAGLLIGIVGFSLVAFILGDLLSNNQGMFSGDNSTVAVISGKKINVQDFEAKVQTSIENYKLNNPNGNVDQNLTDQIREQTYNQLLTDEVMGKQYEKLGLTVTAEELMDMVKGKNPHPQIVQAFTDPNTKQFNPASVVNFLKNMGNDATGRTAAQWVAFEKAIQQERLTQKYNDLVKHGMYVSTAEAKMDWEAKNKIASVRYVMLPYTLINDSTVQVSDEELKAVYDRNLKRYKQEPSRSIEYITFDVKPTEVDRETARKAVEDIKPEFQAATVDSTFIKMNSDNYAEPAYVKKGTLPVYLDSIAFSAANGTVFGPFEENNSFRLAKIVNSRVLPDSVQARHILLKVEGNKDDAMKRADSILTAIKGGADFMIMNFMYSTDEGAKMKGGDLGWFAPNAMVKPFNDAVFEGNKGDRLIVETQFGIHIVEITNQNGGSRQVKVAYLDRRIEPSSKTYQSVFHKANDFGIKNTTADAFDKSVKEQNLTKLTEANVMPSSRQVGPLENSRELVQWMFKANVGDISKVYDFNNRFTIAKLTEVREKGYSTMEQVKDQLLYEARRDKKAQMLTDKLKKAGNASNVDALATAMNTTVQVSENLSFAAPYLSTGMEARVTGKVMAMKDGAVSAPIDGQGGVFVVQVVKMTTPPPPANFNDVALQIRMQNQNRVQYEVFNALRDKADITDNRIRFY